MKKEEIIELKKPSIQPKNHRLFVQAVEVNAKRKSGIILPTYIAQQRGDDKIEHKFYRYFVLAVSKDVQTRIYEYDEKGKEKSRKIQRGDEIYLPFHPDAIEWNYPEIIDWNNEGDKYIVVEQYEIIGAVPAAPADNDQ